MIRGRRLLATRACEGKEIKYQPKHEPLAALAQELQRFPTQFKLKETETAVESCSQIIGFCRERDVLVRLSFDENHSNMFCEEQDVKDNDTFDESMWSRRSVLNLHDPGMAAGWSGDFVLPICMGI